MVRAFTVFDPFDIEAIWWPTRDVILRCGSVYRIATLIDHDGDETDDIDTAVAAVAPHPLGWVSIDLSFYPREITTH